MSSERDYDDSLSQAIYQIRDAVYDNYQAAYVVGTGIILYTLFFHDLILLAGSWLAIIALGFLLEPCVNPHNRRYGWGLVKGEASLGMKVALTFDDGPGPDTGALLDLLAQHQVKATFFCIGTQAKLHPQLVERIAREGHVVGNHTQNHCSLLAASPTRGAREIAEGQATLGKILAEPPRLFRHPYGFRAPWTHSQLKKAGLTSILWSVNPRDFQNPGSSTITERVLSAIHPGAVVLLHDGLEGRLQTLEAVAQLIPKLREQGYEFVTVDQLLPVRS